MYKRCTLSIRISPWRKLLEEQQLMNVMVRGLEEKGFENGEYVP